MPVRRTPVALTAVLSLALSAPVLTGIAVAALGSPAAPAAQDRAVARSTTANSWSVVPAAGSWSRANSWSVVPAANSWSRANSWSVVPAANSWSRANSWSVVPAANSWSAPPVLSRST